MKTLRTVLALHMLGVIVQATLAGQFLSGADAAVPLHEGMGWAVAVLGLVQIGVAFAARVPLWFVVASAGAFLGELLQVGTGYGRFLAVHIPLSILIFGLVVWQTVWAFRVSTE